VLYLYREASPAESPSSRHSLPQGSERRRPCGRPYRKGARWHGHRIHRHRIRRPGPPRSLDRTTSPTLSHTKYSSLCSLCASFSDLCVKPLHRAPSRISPKQQWRKRRKIPPPNHPRMRARRLYIHLADPFRFEPCPQLPIQLNQPVIDTTGNPQQLQFVACLRIQPRKILVEFFRQAARAERSYPRELVHVVQTCEQRLAAAHRKPRNRARVPVLVHKISRLDARQHLAQQSLAEFREVAVAQLRIAKSAEPAAQNFRSAVTQRHHHNHGLGLSLRDQVVQNQVSASHRRPPARVIAESVQQVQHRIALLPTRVIPRRCVDIKVALVSDYRRLVEVMMHFAVRHVADFPRQSSRPRHMHLARGVEQVGLQQWGGRINQVHAIGDECITVKVGCQRLRRDAPNALLVFLHRQIFRRAFQGKRNLLRIWRPKPKRHTAVRMYVWRNHRRRRRLRKSSRTKSKS